MKTKHTPTPLISVHIPDYDTSFTYCLRMGEIHEFNDNNKLDLAHRAQLTDLVTIVNGHLINFNQMKRDHHELVAALEQSEQAMAQLLAASVLAPRVVRSRPSFEHGENLTDSALANARAILAKLKG